MPLNRRMQPHKDKFLPKRDHDAYITPNLVASAIVGLLPGIEYHYPDEIFDPAAGTGAFGRALKERYPSSRIFGHEIMQEAIDENRERLGCYHSIILGDFLTANYTDWKFGLIATNPPFSYFQEYARKCYNMLTDDGWLLLVGDKAYNTGQGRCRLWESMPPALVYQCPRRVTWDGYKEGKTNDKDIIVMIWCKRWTMPFYIGAHFDWKKFGTDHYRNQRAISDSIFPFMTMVDDIQYGDYLASFEGVITQGDLM